MKAWIVVMCLAAPPALAGGCPAAPDHGAALDDLFAAARMAQDEATARRLSGRMWEHWTDAPDRRAQALLDEGMSRRDAYDYEGALAAFDALVSYCPGYAEGYNQRAFIRFLRERHAAALPDLERALELSPRHTGALTGQALTLMALGRPGEAAVALRRALALNPWLAERHLLPQLEALEEEI